MKGPITIEEAPREARNMSYKTAMTRAKLSAPIKRLMDKDRIQGRTHDFGCGKGFDADTLGFDKYDPTYFPDYPTGQYDTIVCNYVLNVLTESDEADILEAIDELLSNEGTAYISVKRDSTTSYGDLTKEGYFTKRGTYQRLVELPFEQTRSEAGFVTYAMYKGESEWVTQQQDTKTTQQDCSSEILPEICQPN